MATVSNKSLNSGSVSNKGFTPSDIIWDDADFTWEQAPGTWDNPQKFINKTINTASVTNKSISG